MSSYFDDASLVMIPSGYKTSKVYSVKPTDGSGDLAFTRSNDTATRVNSAGLIEKVRTNLVLNSATFVTQTIAVGANPHTLSFTGTGTIVATGVGSGTLVGTGASNRVSLSFNTTAGNLILTLTGTATLAQLETGDIATDYIATTTAAVSVGAVANVPRLDYLNSTCPRLLLEPQRTNLVTYSEQIDNAAWTKGQSGTGVAPVVTANNVISPDGTQNADTVVFNSGAGTTASDFSTLYQAFGGTTATYTGSFYAKTASGTAQIQVRIDGTSYTVLTITNQWQRFTLTKALTGTSNVFEMVIRRGLNEPINATATIQLWGFQAELGAYATSYIPTLGAAVTRGDELTTKTSATAIIGQTEGTLFLEFDFVVGEQANYGIIYNAGFSTYIYMNQQVSGSILGQVQPFGITFSVAKPSGRYKCALAYKSGSSAFFVNGVQVGTTNTTTFSPSAMDIFSFLNGNNTKGIHQTLLFPTRLSNSDLAALTA